MQEAANNGKGTFLDA